MIVHPDFENLLKTQPKVTCRNCGKNGFAANYSRIVEHIIGSGQISVCNPAHPTQEFGKLKDKLSMEAAEKAKRKEKNEAANAVNAAASDGPKLVSKFNQKQQQVIEASLSTTTKVLCDQALAELFFGLNLSVAMVDSPLFHNFVQRIRYFNLLRQTIVFQGGRGWAMRCCMRRQLDFELNKHH